MLASKKLDLSFYLIISVFQIILELDSFNLDDRNLCNASCRCQNFCDFNELIDFSFDRSHQMIHCSWFFQWNEWLKSIIHEDIIEFNRSRWDNLAIVTWLSLVSRSLHNSSNSIISIFLWESYLSFTDRREKDIDFAHRRLRECTHCEWLSCSCRNRFTESSSSSILWFDQYVA